MFRSIFPLRSTGSQSSVNAFLQILPKYGGVELYAMPLKLSLKPGETFVVNGAVVRNGDRRGVLLLENRARVLREKDIHLLEDFKHRTFNCFDLHF